MPAKCDCGANAVNSPGHSEWCSSLKSQEEIDGLDYLQALWEEDMNNAGLYPLTDEEDDK